MAWYRAGTVAVTNGSAIVTGTTTDFVSNTQVGEIFVGPDLKVYEIDVVTSATQISVKPPYQGASGGGQTYGIAPTQSFARDLALAFAGFKNTFGGILDTIGQGMFPDGSINAPAVRFSSDQDTGLYKYAANVLAMGAGGSISTLFDGDGALVRRRIRIGLGDPGNQGNTEILTTGTSPVATRLAFGTDGTGYQFAISKNQGGTVTDLLTITDNGNVGVGTSAASSRFEAQEAGTGAGTGGVTASTAAAGGNAGYRWATGGAVRYSLTLAGAAGSETLRLRNENNGTQLFAVDSGGNVRVGTTTGTFRFNVRGSDGLAVQDADGNLSFQVAYGFSGATSGGESSAPSIAFVRKYTQSGRSLNAAGTINASGADYAEYVRKSLACGTILKGDVCGIDSNGELTRTWVDARRYVVKSTDPNLVGGDTWAAHLGPKPEAPIYAAPEYDGPARPVEPTPAADPSAEQQQAYAADYRQYRDSLAAFDQAQDAHRAAVATAEAAYAVALAAHDEALAAWEGELEAARQTVDRIAFSGQVPVNVDPDTLAACEAASGDGVAVYLVAVARGAGIGVTAVRETDMTLQQYMRRLGAVWAVRDGRPWIDVQHG